jgi:predicted NAD-dependent protein-ADP-ribosyltransferase YbiA (DUF1768 family)
MERLADLLSDFRETHGDDPDSHEDTFEDLMEIVEAAENLVANDASQHTVDSTSGVGLTLFEPFPVDYDGLVYDTAFNAFQAQKAPRAEREAFCQVDTPTATMLGRKCTIDIAAWDANRVTLMTDILKKQASQNQAFRECILTHAARTDIVHNSMMHDPFWSKEMPGILKSLYDHFEKKRSKKRAKLAAA